MGGILAGDRSSTFRSFWLVTCRYCIGRYSQYSLSDFQFAIVLLNKGINCESGGSVGPWQKLFLWLLAICLSPRAPEESQGISAGLNICWSSLISMLPCTKCRKVFFTCTSQLDSTETVGPTPHKVSWASQHMDSKLMWCFLHKFKQVLEKRSLVANGLQETTSGSKRLRANTSEYKPMGYACVAQACSQNIESPLCPTNE